MNFIIDEVILWFGDGSTDEEERRRRHLHARLIIILIFSEEKLKFRRTMPFFVTFENEISVSELLFLFFPVKKKTCDTNRI